MMDLLDKETRIKLGNHAKYKADVYKQMKNCNLFVESNYAQAIEIAKLSQKAVFCTENSCFIEEGFVERIKESVQNSASIKKQIKKILPKSAVAVLRALRMHLK